MMLNIEDIFKCSCLEIMSQRSDSGDQKDNPQERLLDDSSEDEPIDPTLKTTEEEHRGTVPDINHCNGVSIGRGKSSSKSNSRKRPATLPEKEQN